MRRAFLFVVGAGIAIAIAWWLAGLPGHVDVAIGQYAFSASAPVAIVVTVLVFLLLHLLLRFGALLGAVPRRARVQREGRRRVAGDRAVTGTLVAIAAADRSGARRDARRARRMLGDTPQTLLLAAEAERLAGHDDDAADLYRRLAGDKDAAFLGLRGLFRQAMAREDWIEAAALVKRAETVRPGADWLRDERSQLAVRSGDWAQALALAPPGAPANAYAVAAAEAERDPAEALRLAKQAFKRDPGFTPAALAYASRLRASDRETRAQSVLRDAWAQNPHPDLASLALVPYRTGVERFREAGRIVALNANHVESHMLLARLALDAGLVGEARRHTDAARALGLDQRRLWLLLADLARAEHPPGSPEIQAAQEAALRHAAEAQSDPAWRCGACGTVLPQWRAACPTCHTPGRIAWTVTAYATSPAAPLLRHDAEPVPAGGH